MNTTQRIHITLLLLTILTSVILFSFGITEIDEILWSSILLLAFGEVALLVDRMYRRLDRAGRRKTYDSTQGMPSELNDR